MKDIILTMLTAIFNGILTGLMFIIGFFLIFYISGIFSIIAGIALIIMGFIIICKMLFELFD